MAKRDMTRSRELPVLFRPARDGDLALILSTWIRGHKEMGFSRGVGPSEYYQGQRALCERLLASHRAVVACADDDDDVVYGWVLADGQVLHYGHVKSSLRGLGLEAALLRAAGVDADKPIHASHVIPSFRGVGVYDPYLVLS